MILSQRVSKVHSRFLHFFFFLMRILRAWFLLKIYHSVYFFNSDTSSKCYLRITLKNYPYPYDHLQAFLVFGSLFFDIYERLSPIYFSIATFFHYKLHDFRLNFICFFYIKFNNRSNFCSVWSFKCFSNGRPPMFSIFFCCNYSDKARLFKDIRYLIHQIGVFMHCTERSRKKPLFSRPIFPSTRRVNSFSRTFAYRNCKFFTPAIHISPCFDTKILKEFHFSLTYFAGFSM